MSCDRLPIFELFRQAMRSDAAAVTTLAVMLAAGIMALAGCQQVRFFVTIRHSSNDITH